MSAMLVKCEKCGGDVTIGTLRAQGIEVFVAGTLSVGTSPVEAHICTECGYTALFASHPSALRLRAQPGAQQTAAASQGKGRIRWSGGVGEEYVEEEDGEDSGS